MDFHVPPTEKLVELAAGALLDFYQVLNVKRDATNAEIKAAYHRALLLSHPDKSPGQVQQTVTISMIKEAYQTLSTPDLRKKYHVETLKEASAPSGPRPAQIISLEEFDEDEDEEKWTYGCRCSGKYQITGLEMEKGQHLVGCSSCSETIWVGFELQDDDD